MGRMDDKIKRLREEAHDKRDQQFKVDQNKGLGRTEMSVVRATTRVNHMRDGQRRDELAAVMPAMTFQQKQAAINAIKMGRPDVKLTPAEREQILKIQSAPTTQNQHDKIVKDINEKYEPKDMQEQMDNARAGYLDNKTGEWVKGYRDIATKKLEAIRQRREPIQVQRMAMGGADAVEVFEEGAFANDRERNMENVTFRNTRAADYVTDNTDPKHPRALARTNTFAERVIRTLEGVGVRLSVADEADLRDRDVFVDVASILELVHDEHFVTANMDLWTFADLINHVAFMDEECNISSNEQTYVPEYILDIADRAAEFAKQIQAIIAVARENKATDEKGFLMYKPIQESALKSYDTIDDLLLDEISKGYFKWHTWEDIINMDEFTLAVQSLVGGGVRNVIETEATREAEFEEQVEVIVAEARKTRKLFSRNALDNDYNNNINDLLTGETAKNYLKWQSWADVIDTDEFVLATLSRVNPRVRGNIVHEAVEEEERERVAREAADEAKRKKEDDWDKSKLNPKNWGRDKS